MIVRILLGAAGLLVLVGTALVANAWVAFGHGPDGDRQARMEASP